MVSHPTPPGPPGPPTHEHADGTTCMWVRRHGIDRWRQVERGRDLGPCPIGADVKPGASDDWQCNGGGDWHWHPASVETCPDRHRAVSLDGWACDTCGLPVSGQTDETGRPLIEGDSIRHVAPEGVQKRR